MIIFRFLVGLCLVADAFLIIAASKQFDYPGTYVLTMKALEWFALLVVGGIAVLFVWAAIELHCLHGRMSRIENDLKQRSHT